MAAFCFSVERRKAAKPFSLQSRSKLNYITFSMSNQIFLLRTLTTIGLDNT